jgi:hypothetical protein
MSGLSSGRVAVTFLAACLAPFAAPASASANPTPEAVTIAVASSGTVSPEYRVEVHNETQSPVDVTVRQVVPHGTAVQAVSTGGRADAAEVTWQLQLPAHATEPLATSLTPTPTAAPVVVPACAYHRDGRLPYDCAAASWALPPPPPAPEPSPWRWQLIAILAGVAALLILAGLRWWLRRRRNRRTPRPMPGQAATSSTAGPAQAVRRRDPPVWRVVGLAVVLLVALTALGVRAAAVAFNVIGKKASAALQEGRGWIGEPTVGPLGATLREAAFEFAVYRFSCQSGTAEPSRRCIATVGVHNVSAESQPWYSMLQRAYLPGGTWVSADEAATTDVNGGIDLFSAPLPPGADMLVPVAFTVPSNAQPDRIELRSGVFSAGVTVNCQ